MSYTFVKMKKKCALPIINFKLNKTWKIRKQKYSLKKQNNTTTSLKKETNCAKHAHLGVSKKSIVNPFTNPPPPLKNTKPHKLQ